MAEETAGYPLDLVKVSICYPSFPPSPELILNQPNPIDPDAGPWRSPHRRAGHSYSRLLSSSVSSSSAPISPAVVRETLQKEGVRGLFKGLGPPFLASSVTTAVIFGNTQQQQHLPSTSSFSIFCFRLHHKGSYAHVVDFLHERYGKRGQARLAHVALAGAASGFAQSFIICPIDVIKNRMQVRTRPPDDDDEDDDDNCSQVAGLGHEGGHGPGSIAMARQVIASRGWLGLYLGMVPTLWRDVPG